MQRRLNENRDDYAARRAGDRDSDPSIMLGVMLVGTMTFVFGFVLGAWIF